MEVFFAEGTNRISRHDLQKVHPFNGGHRRPSFPTDYHYRFPTKTKRELTRVRCFVPDRNLLGVFWGEFLWKVQKKVPIHFSSPTRKRQLTIVEFQG